MIRRSLVLVSIVLLSACSQSVEDDQSAADQNVAQELVNSSASVQPNVLFILVDDMGFGDVGYNGSEIATPNLDQMAHEGMTLDRNYVYPVCSPTRAALLSGQNPCIWVLLDLSRITQTSPRI